MTAQTHRTRSLIESVPDTLESAQAKLVYVYLEATGGTTVDDLVETLSIPRLSALSVLNTLSSAGVVEQRGNEYVVVS